MPTPQNAQRFLNAVGDPNGAKFSPTEIDDYFEEAEEEYPSYSAKVHLRYAILRGIEDLRAQAATQVDYRQNESSENLSQMFKALNDMYESAQAELDAAVSAEAGTQVRFGGARPFPTRIEEYPDA